MRFTLLVAFLGVTLLVGCKRPTRPDDEPAHDGPIFGKTTKDIKKFDPAEEKEIEGGEFRNDSGVLLYGLDGYASATQRIAQSHVKHAIDLYHAEHGKYPKDYKEFMDKIVKPNHIELPKLKYSLEYQYDEQNHQLVVVKKNTGKKADKKQK